MKTKSFIELLDQHSEKELVFAYGEGLEIPKAWHITEIKNVHVDSVDCGGFQHAYDETIVQLWISEKESPEKHMLAGKAAKIFDIVAKKRPLLEDTDILFEYGYQSLPTSVYKVDQVEEKGDRLYIRMSVPATACKPLLKVVEACCGPACC